MSFLKGLLKRVLPSDPVEQCGYGIFSLPPDHPFTRGCNLHDWGFGEAEKGSNEKTLIEEDVQLFYRWTLIAKAAPTPERQAELMMDICRYWPYARRFGPLLWDGDDELLLKQREKIKETLSKDYNNSK